MLLLSESSFYILIIDGNVGGKGLEAGCEGNTSMPNLWNE